MIMKRNDVLHGSKGGFEDEEEVAPAPQPTEQQKAQAQAFMAKAQAEMNLTDLQLKVNQEYRGDVYEPNAPEFFATEAMNLSANAGKAAHVIAKITKNGFDKPEGDEELATALLSASAMSIVHAVLIIDEMGYSLEEVMKGVL